MNKQVKQPRKKTKQSAKPTNKKKKSTSLVKKNGKSSKIKTTKKTKRQGSKAKSKDLTLVFLGLLGIGFLVLAVIFYNTFSQADEINDAYVKQVSGSAIPWQYILFGILGLSGLYFSWRLIRQTSKVIVSDWIALSLAFVVSSSLYIFAFNKRVSINGDNAEYVIVAKSLVEKGGAYRLESRREGKNTLSSIGLPIMLAPIYAIWGLDTYKMKILVALVGILLFPILFWLFRKEQDFWSSALLAITGASSAYLVSSSTTIMTEIPYIFWSALALFAVIHYKEQNRFKWQWALISILLMVMTYFTRAVGIGAFAAAGIYLFIHVPWKEILVPFNWKKLFGNSAFQRLFFLFAPLVFFGIIWQVRQQLNGVSQADIFFKEDMWSVFGTNALSGIQVLAQMLFSSDAFKWVSFSSAYNLPTLNFGWMLLDAIIFLGMIRLLLRKSIIGIYGLIIMLLVFFGSLDPSQMVSIRYLSVIAPFLIYYFWMGCGWIFELLATQLKKQWIRGLGYVVSSLFVIQIIFTSQLCNSFTILRSYVGYGPGYDNYFKALDWCKESLPDDAFILSIKPRITYVFTEKKGSRITVPSEEYDEAYETRKLGIIEKNQASHLIVDDLSGSTRKNIVPLIQNNPDKFEQIYTTGGARATSVYKVL